MSRLEMMIRVVGVTVAVSVSAVSSLKAQVEDVAGVWNLAVKTSQGETSPTVILEQEGAEVTGRYLSQTLGNADLKGTVEGSRLTFTFPATINVQQQPTPVTVTYSLTLNGDGQLVGQIDVGGLVSGLVVGTRE